MLDPDRLLTGLNDAQREAVTTVEGPVLVLAGPGSGKTRVLTHRVAYIIGVVGVPAWHLMSVTFTNKAAKEMKERLGGLIGPTALDQLTIGTFHAICARLLRRETQALPFDDRFVIFDTDDQLRAVKQAMADLNLDEKTYRPQSVLGAISSAKNELIRAEDFVAPSYWHEVAGRVYKRYQAVLRANNALDFDDLLLETALLLRDNEAVAARYRDRYGFLMVDEFQDTNTAQYAMLRSLTAADDKDAQHNLCAVGDEDQSIYRWRGADYRNIMRLRKDFPAVKVILLEQNYRSSQTILDAARAVIDVNAHRTKKALWSELGDGDKVTLFEAYDEQEEAAYIVREIQRRNVGGGRYGDCAIMYRTNAQSRVLEDAFVRAHIPYQLVGGTRFYERREVRDMLAYLRFVHNPRDEMALGRIINVPPRAIGPKALTTLAARAQAAGQSLWEALCSLAADAFPDELLPPSAHLDARGRGALVRFQQLMAEVIANRDLLPADQLLDQLLDLSGYARWLKDGTEEGEERWENVQELRGLALDYHHLSPQEGLGAMLEAVALAGDADTVGEGGSDRVTLLTLHAAKGLEYPVVFMPGLEERILPHSRSIDDPESLAEERRLFYVGITRAMRKLYLVHVFRRTLYGSSEMAEPSRFLRDLPAGSMELRSKSGVTTPNRAAAARSSATTWAPNRPPQASIGTPATGGAVVATAASNKAQFKAGDRVRHSHFGAGVVVSSAVKDGDEEVTVAFVGGAGVKKLMQRFAKLEKV
jgi:DNA helicase-2/ATP-dependent DNA helicase PcrA